ncbi:MAG: deoxyribodipyrimidine photo-lyase [Thaumarchaeota archaeon]|nr:deoxyribodipyrimidine photo-lyase [Candidatus Calditenuaceae archaeon]
MVPLPGFMRVERLHVLRADQEANRGEFVTYVVYASHRSVHNYALEYAIHAANALGKPAIVVFPLIERKPHPNLRRFRFMLEGLLKLRGSLEGRGIKLVVRKNFDFLPLIRESCLVVLDRPYLAHQRRYIDEIVKGSESRVVMVEGDVTVPVEVVSPRPEPYARTIRPKVLRKLDVFLEDVPALAPKTPSLDLDVTSWDEDTVEGYVRGIEVDHTVDAVDRLVGGEDEALRRLRTFVGERLPFYSERRSDPGAVATSELSPYLRWGMISPVQVLREVLKHYALNDVNVQTLINELVVWRELARNAAVYNPDFGKFEGLPLWARSTLEDHAGDRREHIYSLRELERAQTHDRYWNAAQRELLSTGKVHNYMRMYWCKKLIEWTETPQRAFEYAVYLNDRYGLDGLDPNSYLGISWCFGAFDRPFFESKIYGKVRRMTEESLKRKSGIQLYLSRYS